MNQGYPEKCDVLVVGGGPAGSMTAARLAQYGVEVLLFEKEEFPRDKVGESLIPQFWRYVDLIGATQKIEDHDFTVKAGASTCWNGRFRKLSFTDFGYSRPGLHVERAEFDQILLDTAGCHGAQIFHKVQVSKIIHGQPWTTVTIQDEDGQESEVKTRFVVDSTGQHALLAKQEGCRVFDKGFRFQAFWGYFEDGDFLDSTVAVRSLGEQKEFGPITLLSSVGDWGWVWQIVLKSKISVGLILPRAHMPKFRALGTSLRERFQAQVRQTPLIGKLMEDARLTEHSIRSIRDYAYKPTRLTIGNCFLTGDAAAFVDPINSTGVVMALYSGYLAAWCIHRILGKSSKKAETCRLYESQLKLRLDLFRLISFPSDLVTPRMMSEGRRLIKLVSEDEKNLILSQIMLTNRAKNLGEKLGYGFPQNLEEKMLTQIIT